MPSRAIMPSFFRPLSVLECAPLTNTGILPNKVNFIGWSLFTANLSPLVKVLALSTLTKTLPAGSPHFKLMSTSVALKLPLDTPAGKPKSEGRIFSKDKTEHSTVSKIPSLSSSTSTLSGTPSPSVSVYKSSIELLGTESKEIRTGDETNNSNVKRATEYLFMLEAEIVIFSIGIVLYN
ncbi:hypothetical protein [Allomuricauda sp. d1]|uniref:hypothetical protein n=1 Tax=Allomuricauda sp. d1 TaxID=3136725 RepID=UPI0031DB22C2